MISILLVEDNASDATQVQRRLSASSCGEFDVVVVGWLSTALTLLRNRSFSAILLDLTLPDSHGIDTVVAIKKEAPNTPVIVTSGQEDLGIATRSLEAGADSFVVKPLSTAELERVIFFGLERAKRDRTTRELIQNSVRRITLNYSPGSVAPPPVAGLLIEPVNRIDDVVQAILQYLRKNHPAAAPSVEQMLSQMGYNVSVQALRSALKMDEIPSHTSSSLTHRASELLSGLGLDEDLNPEDVLNQIIGGSDVD